MKVISVLKKLITIYYYLLFIGLIAKLFKVVFKFISGNIRNLKPKIFGVQLDYSDMNYGKIIFTILLSILLYYFYFQAIKYLKDSLEDLESENYFSNLVVKNFKKIGILFVIISFGEVLGKLVFFLILKSKIHLKLDTSVALFFIMGLFFMFLSEVFKKGNTIQQENDLTI